jgi:hypothetical protein
MRTLVWARRGVDVTIKIDGVHVGLPIKSWS